MRRYELIDNAEELNYIEIREIAYSKEDIPKLEDSFAEAEYYLKQTNMTYTLLLTATPFNIPYYEHP